MNTPLIDGRLQITAAASLLEKSRLVEWDTAIYKFQPVKWEVFDLSWRDIDPVFGRLICWIMFAAGAEFLAKGICLVNGIGEFRDDREVPRYPDKITSKWISEFRKNQDVGGTMTVTNFGTLKDLMSPKKGKAAPLTWLCRTVNAKPEQEDLLLAAYKLLQRTIRNRDAHAYVPNVRDLHHSLVPDLFSDCFNLLVSWLPDGPGTLNKWRDEAASFVTSL